MSWEPNYRPSNGTEGDMFRTGPMGCLSCTVDHNEGWHTGNEDTGQSCPILMHALLEHDGPDQWEQRRVPDDKMRLGYRWETRCTGWRGPCACTKGTTYEPPPEDWLTHNAPDTDITEDD